MNNNKPKSQGSASSTNRCGVVLLIEPISLGGSTSYIALASVEEMFFIFMPRENFPGKTQLTVRGWLWMFSFGAEQAYSPKFAKEEYRGGRGIRESRGEEGGLTNNDRGFTCVNKK